MRKVTIDEVLEVEDFLTQQLDVKSGEANAAHYTSYGSLMKGASAEIKRLRKIIKDWQDDETV